MEIAVEEANCALAENEVPVGAVVVKDGMIVGKAHNLCTSQKDPSAHAEMIALREAYTRLGSLDGCTLYVTLEPCAMCAGAMIHMRLPRLVYGAFDLFGGCCGSRIDLGDHWFDHCVETVGGIMQKQCASLITKFFHQLRIQ